MQEVAGPAQQRARVLTEVVKLLLDTYAPDRSALVIAGDFDTRAVESTVREAFGALAPKPPPAESPPRRTLHQPRAIDLLPAFSEQAGLAIATAEPSSAPDR